MDEPKRRFVVTGGRSPLGRRILEELRDLPTCEHVRGVEAKARGGDRKTEDLDFVPFAPDHRPFTEYLEKNRIDTVVHCGLVPDRMGLPGPVHEADVIGTMCLGAAIAHEGSSVRNWVIASSSAIYTVDSHSALLQTERSIHSIEHETLASSIAEAEEYARDVALRRPHLNVAILRLQHLVGRNTQSPLARLFAQDRIPVPIGFDPAIQLLHIDDAASAIVFATRSELAGLYNVASEGLIHWRDAIRVSGRQAISVPPASVAMLEPLLRRFQIPFVPADLLELLRFGHAVDTQKIRRAGWSPEYDQHRCLSSVD